MLRNVEKKRRVEEFCSEFHSLTSIRGPSLELKTILTYNMKITCSAVSLNEKIAFTRTIVRAVHPETAVRKPFI